MGLGIPGFSLKFIVLHLHLKVHILLLGLWGTFGCTIFARLQDVLSQDFWIKQCMVVTCRILELRVLILVFIHVEICERFRPAAPDRRTIICLSGLKLCIVDPKIYLFALIDLMRLSHFPLCLRRVTPRNLLDF